MIKTAQVVAALSILPMAAWADYVVDVNLGVLPSGGFPVDIAVVGSTAGKPNNADFHLATTSNEGNWGREVVYQFQVSDPNQPLAITLTLNTQSGTNGGDVDFVLLTSLATGLDPDGSGKKVALDDIDFEGLDGSLPESYRFSGLTAGTYYLVAEHFDGFDPPPATTGDTTFTATMTVEAATVEDFDIVLGPIGSAGEPLVFDTFGSAIDTELALFGLGNEVVATSNDVGGTSQSYLAVPDGLAAGFYYLAVAGFDTTFGDNLVFGSGGATGAHTLHYSQGSTFVPDTISGETSSLDSSLEVQLYCFEIVDPPPAPINVGSVTTALQPFSISTIGSDFDTELSLFDRNGFLLATNDDQVPPDFDLGEDCSTLGRVCQSEIVLPDGLAAGTYYAVLTGFGQEFDNGFFAQGFGSDLGNYTFVYPSGSQTGTLTDPLADPFVPPGDQQWFRFDVAAGAPVEIKITDINFPAPGILALTWDSVADTKYRIDTALELDAWVPYAVGISSAGTSTMHFATGLKSDHRYFRVVEE